MTGAGQARAKTTGHVCDLAILNGDVVTSGWRGRATIAISGGRVSAILDPSVGVEAGEYYDASDRVIIPALVDTHVHLRDPGHTHKEDFYSGTCAAAAGGYGTIVAQPNTSPSGTDVEGVGLILEAGRKRSVVDFAVSALATPENTENIAALVQAGACTVDIATCDVPDAWMMTRGGDILRVFEQAGRMGVPVAVYGTDASIVASRTESLVKSGRKDPMAWAEGRPGFAEAAEVSRIAVLARETRAKVLFRQISAGASVQSLRSLKPSSLISVEVNPHHLFLTDEALEERGPWVKMAPPLRPRSDVDALWAGLFDGTIDMLGGDHAPHAYHEKAAGVEDIWKAASGVPSLETALPLFLTEAAAGGVSLQQVVRWMAENPARWLGVYPRKGTIAVGSDADFAVIDTAKEWEIRGSAMHGKPGWTPFEGRHVRGAVEATMVRGRWVYRSGRVVAEPGSGRIVAPVG